MCLAKEYAPREYALMEMAEQFDSNRHMRLAQEGSLQKLEFHVQKSFAVVVFRLLASLCVRVGSVPSAFTNQT